MIAQLHSLQTAGVYKLFFENNVYIGYGKNMLSSIYNLLQALKLHTKNYNEELIALYNADKLSFEVVELCPEVQLRVRAAYWHSQYKLHNNMLNNIPAAVYKTEIRLISRDSRLLACVLLKPGNTLVGAFESIQEAKSFIAQHYGTPIANITFADNEPTRKLSSAPGSLAFGSSP